MTQEVKKNKVAALVKSLPERSENQFRQLTNQQRQMVACHMPLAYAMAWRMRERGVCLKDLRQEGFLGLCEAALRFAEDAQCNFATYARYWCGKMIFRALRKNEACGSQQDDPQSEADDGEDLLRLAQQRRIDEALQSLSEKERQIVEQHYGIGCKQLSISEIAATHNISKARASALHLRALQKLHTALVQRPLLDYLDPQHE